MRNFRASLGPHRYVQPIGRLEYRARILKNDLRGHASTYYDGGPLTPYTIEAIVELVLAEAAVDCNDLEVTLDLDGHCSDMLIDDIASRFACIEAPGVRAQVRAFGHATRVAVANPVALPVSGH